MPRFDPGLLRIMKSAFEEVMTRVPSEYSTIGVKAYLADHILRAAARGQTSYDELVAVTADQIGVIVSLSANDKRDRVF